MLGTILTTIVTGVMEVAAAAPAADVVWTSCKDWLLEFSIVDYFLILADLLA